MTPLLDVLIIGSGFSGLGMAIALKKEGRRSFVVLEKAGEVGGTWRENTYPGCACDIPSQLYSFSFEPEPNWTRVFPPQAEILAYLKRCADKYGLEPHLRFGAEVVEAAWDEAARLWRVATRDGRRFRARAVVAGKGALHRPAIPELPGLEGFAGPAFHSAEWRHDVDLTGKRVAVVGTGASAIQFVPKIAPLAERLTVFQRTPPWIVPKPDRPISEQSRARFARRPWLQAAVRGFWYWFLEKNARARLDPRLAGPSERLALKHLHAQIADPDLRAKLTPDYRLGCKRVLISDDYYHALTRPNVALETAPIARVEPDAVATADGRRTPADVLIFGTGFQVTDQSSDPLEVVGRDGLRLKEAWRDGLSAHLGITVAGFPNWFLLMGPHTGLGHNSMVYMIESQIRYVMSALQALDRRAAAALEVTPSAQAAFAAEMDRKLKGTVWMSGCGSWYLDRQGRNTTVWPDYTFRYRARTRAIDPGDFRFLPAAEAEETPARVSPAAA
ncbi:MAG TPA: NAD(P)/FAD-dependent oxidoreductase [Caulobacteraceae bacterium]|nr:NAD(P)/FAD-dependent oxidoreductase [Caulobacteraceae bacterium]